MKYLTLFILGSVALFSSCTANRIEGNNASREIAGRYSDGKVTFVFKDNKCFGYGPDNKLMSESPYFVKGDLVFISPPEKDLKKMIRRVFGVYKMRGNKLIFSHVEDMDTGDRFYEEKAGEIVLEKK